MLELYPKTFEEFVKEAEKGNVVPIVRSVPADLHTPVSAFMRVAKAAKKSFLLESIEGGEKIARYLFLAAHPFITVSSRKRQVIIEKNGEEEVLPDKTFDRILRGHFSNNYLSDRENLPPLCGGAIGYTDYAENPGTCIAIRTISLENKEASIQAEAGIAADSVPENEFEETLNKARALKKVIEIAEDFGENQKHYENSYFFDLIDDDSFFCLVQRCAFR